MRGIVIALAFLAATAAAVECVGTISDVKNHRSYQFDLSSLHHDDSTYVDTLWYRTDDNTIYYVNFCGQTASACESEDTSVCIRVPDGDDYKYNGGGRTSTQKITIAEASDQSPSSSVTVTYSNGDNCAATNGNYKTKIYVNCQQTANPGYFYNIDQPNSCDATLYMWAAAGCGKEVPYVDPPDDDSSADAGETVAIVILVILLVSVVVYFAAGAVYNWKVNGASEVSEFIIHKDFWTSLPFLVKDGVMFIAHGFKKGDYVSI